MVCERVGGFFGMIFSLIIQIAHRHIATTKKEVKIQAKQKKKKKKKHKKKNGCAHFFCFFSFLLHGFFFFKQQNTHTKRNIRKFTLHGIQNTRDGIHKFGIVKFRRKKNMVKI